MSWRTLILSGIFLGIASTQPAWATEYRVEIDTSALQGEAGAIAFDFTSNTPGDNHVIILNFTHDGTTGLPETQGGLVLGDIILLLNPAPFTEIEGFSFFNELIVPFTSFGTQISFTVELTENPSGAGVVPDEFSFFILGANRQVLFSSADPLGADTLFAICIDGTASGLLNPFDPTVFTPPDLLEIAASEGDLDGDGIPDDIDECPNSDLISTVIIDGCDSKVPNTVLTTGCSISDLITMCASDVSNHGQFTSCVSQLTNELRNTGIISGKQKGAIQSCAVRADIP